jgi:hypothetical protein
MQARGALKKELMNHLRSKRRMRRSQHSGVFKDSRGQIVEAISIRERPAEVEDRAIPGPWEGDLLCPVPSGPAYEPNSGSTSRAYQSKTTRVEGPTLLCNQVEYYFKCPIIPMRNRKRCGKRRTHFQ